MIDFIREEREKFYENCEFPVLFCLILWYTDFIIIDIVGVLCRYETTKSP